MKKIETEKLIELYLEEVLKVENPIVTYREDFIIEYKDSVRTYRLVLDLDYITFVYNRLINLLI